MGAEARHRVVIVGGGFGGLFAARFLKRAPVEVTLIDRVNYHLFQPLLYQLATGILSEGEVAPPIRGILRKHRNVKVECATVTHFDLVERTVTATRPDNSTRTHAFDSLVVAAGAGQSYFGHDEFARFAPGMKTIDDALELRGRIFGAFEMAESEDDAEARRAWMTFVVVGGGPTGVEIAGQIAELSRAGLDRNFRGIDPAQAHVILYDGGDEILANFGDRLSHKASRELEKLGVEIRTGSIVTGVDALGVTVQSADGTTHRVSARTKIWAAGVQASPLAGLLAEASGATCDRAGRIAVLEDCTLPGHPEVFAIGDMMALDKLPGVAEVAMQSGIHAANTIKRRLHGKEAASVQVPRPRQHGRHLPVPGDSQLQGPPAVRVPRMVDVARRAHHVPDRFQEPLHGTAALEQHLPRRGACRADHHAAPDHGASRHRGSRRRRPDAAADRHGTGARLMSPRC